MMGALKALKAFYMIKPSHGTKTDLKSVYTKSEQAI